MLNTMDISVRTYCFLLVLSFFLFFDSSASDIESALVVGTVYCDTCFHQQFTKSSHFISGASVAVECGDYYKKEVKTNRHGVFRVRLPPKLNTIKTCSISLIRSNEPFCSVASSSPKSSTLHLKSKRNNGIHVFSAGLFAFKPMKQPELCNNFDSFFSVNKIQEQPAQPAFFFPPLIPFLPSPGLPLPPNPLVPPPSILPPVIPSPPTSVLPPVIPSPPPSLFPPLPNIPPLPFITPPPPPPASLFPPFPIPMPPNPLFPGIPPAPRAEETSP